MPRHFHAAPWPRALKVSSAFGSLLVAGIGIAVYRAIPTASGFTHAFGLGMALVLPGLLVISVLFSVTGYVVDGAVLYVQRLLWRSRLPLDGVSRFWLEPLACKGSLRVFGNGGLFSFTGLYQSPALGRYRLFGTDLSRSVVVVLPRRVLVVTPAAPEAFLAHLHQNFPAAHLGMEGWRA